MATRKGARKRARPKRKGGTPNPGLPDKSTVLSERTFVSPKGRRYRIITTTEKDPYDPPDDDK